MPDEVVCPIPRAITHEEARDMFAKVRKEMRQLTDAGIRREAARRLGIDYDTYLKAWKKPPKSPPVQPPPVTPTPAPTPTPTPITTLTYDTARAQHKLVKKEFPNYTDAQARREAARRMNVDYDTFLRAWKKPKDAKITIPRPDVPHTPAPYTVTPPPPVRKKIWATKGERKALTQGPLEEQRLAFNTSKFTVGGQEFAAVTNIGSRSYVKLGPGNVSKSFKTREEADKFVRDVYENGLPDHLAVNPGYSVKRGTTRNCPSTATSWELRRRGYDVVARTMPDGQPLRHIFRAWGIRLEHMVGHDKLARSAESGFTNPFRWSIDQGKLPDGARGFISVEWNKGGAHIYNWEKRDGEIWYIDAQPGKEWAAKDDHYLDNAKPRMWIARVDEIRETENISWLTSDKGQVRTVNPYESRLR